MTLLFSTSGRPSVWCINPNCGKTHAIYRRGDYVKRSQIYVQCKACGTKWKLTDKEIQELQDHYEKRQKELESKKQEKEHKKREKEQQFHEKKFQIKDETSVKGLEKTGKEAPKKSKSFWEQIGLGD